ncbi:MAG: SDR family NAD(P)-dependent oxidoreductase [Candidatus Baltobacteraceae bacterium]|jgi:short-subunit dehydrogenase
MSDRRVAIVTGASSGIGLALAERAVRAGYDVLAVGRRAERLAALARDLELAAGRISTLALELRTPGAAGRIVREALARFERIDILVNNAGAVAVGPITQQSDAALHEQFETHVIAPLTLVREALPALHATRGHVFFVGSGVARIPVSLLGAYPPAKAAVRSLARIVRNELRGDGIAVTYVDPGAVASEFMTRAGFPGPPPGIAASPQQVARKIFAAFETRQPVVNAVPWQTAFVSLGEALPGLTDFLLTRAPEIAGVQTLPVHEAPAALPPEVQPLAPEPPAAQSPFAAALEPVAARMRKLNLSETFVRSLLVPGTALELGDVALRWAGMPNKNERALTREVLEALAGAGYLERTGAEAYVVTRRADGST